MCRDDQGSLLVLDQVRHHLDDGVLYLVGEGEVGLPGDRGGRVPLGGGRVRVEAGGELGPDEIAFVVDKSLAALAVVWALSGVLGPRFDAPHVARYMPVFIVGALCDRVEFLPERMLIRKLRFRWLSLSRAAAALLAGIQGGVSVLLNTGDLSYLEAALDVGIANLRK